MGTRYLLLPFRPIKRHHGRTENLCRKGPSTHFSVPANTGWERCLLKSVSVWVFWPLRVSLLLSVMKPIQKLIHFPFQVILAQCQLLNRAILHHTWIPRFSYQGGLLFMGLHGTDRIYVWDARKILGTYSCRLSFRRFWIGQSEKHLNCTSSVAQIREHNVLQEWVHEAPSNGKLKNIMVFSAFAKYPLLIGQLPIFWSIMLEHRRNTRQSKGYATTRKKTLSWPTQFRKSKT